MKRFGLMLLAIHMIAASSLIVAEDTAVPVDQKITFEEHVLPIFKAHCIKCHAGAEPSNGLSLISRRQILRGGKSGPGIRIAAAESSLLWEMLAGNQMPKDGPPLSNAEKGIIRSWINDGAASSNPEADAAENLANMTEDAEEAWAADHWAFRTPVRPAIPEVRNSQRVLTEIDRFVIAALEKEELELSPPANAVILARRAWYDLLGLPPTPEELNQYLRESDASPQTAWVNLIDRLLQSPHYGERWGRHWLDLAGYADSAGILAEDRPLPSAFRYRDYVIRSFNSDKPYDRFLQEQIAGDELSDYWTADATQESLPESVVEAVTATGFLRCAPDASRPDFSTIKNADAQYFYPTLQDTLQIVASSTMGLTLQCARCHSHKFDPIPQTDYYRLQAVFMPALRPSKWIPQMERRLFVATASQRKTAEERNAEVDKEVARLQEEQKALRESFRTRLYNDRLKALPAAVQADVLAALEIAADQRTPIQAYLVAQFQAHLRPDDASLESQLTMSYREYGQKAEQNRAAVAVQQGRRMAFDELRALYDLPGDVVTPLLIRGDALTPGPPVEPGVPAVLSSAVPFSWNPPSSDAKTSCRRLAFARWLTHPDHPLTARVFANRVWLHHFGEGIVSTPEDFGTLGSPPSHPELLDWLAREFVESGWSIKKLHRLIMTSAVYQQSSSVNEKTHAAAIEKDPEDRLLWRQRLRRLEAEPLRDAMLAASGLLDRQLFGYPIPMARRPDGEVTVVDGAVDRRRSIYLQVIRGNPLTLMQSFDQPVMETNCVRRVRSTVATQALTLLNSESVRDYATGFADRLIREGGSDPAGYAVLCGFSRLPDPGEVQTLNGFVEAQQQLYAKQGLASDEARRNAFADLCQMLMSSNEFLYVD
ncbi:MAG: PSD1 and planctomycete cytochrome C domain-containing protein [Planctomyces sp.]